MKRVLNIYLLKEGTILQGRHFHAHFTDGEAEDTNATSICSHSQGWQVVEPEFEPRLI